MEKLRKRASYKPTQPATPVAVAVKSTTRQGMTFHFTSNKNATRAMATSTGFLTVLVQTGEYKAAPRTPTTEAFTPARVALTRRLLRMFAQNGRMPAIKSKPAKKDRHKCDCRSSDSVYRTVEDCAQVSRERKEGARNGLCCPVPGEKGLFADPALRYRCRVEQRQHNVSAAEDERTAPIESIENGPGRSCVQERSKRNASMKTASDITPDQTEFAVGKALEAGSSATVLNSRMPQSAPIAIAKTVLKLDGANSATTAPSAADACALAVWCKLLLHGEDSLRDDRYRHKL